MAFRRKSGDEATVLKRRVQVATMYLKGKTQADMALDLGVSVNTISSDLAACREVWLAKMSEAFSQKKAEELAKLDKVEEEAWLAWNKSVKDQEVVVTKTESMVQAKKRTKLSRHKMTPLRQSVEKTVRGQAGDPRFLDVITKVIETRLKVIGVFKEGSSGNTVVTLNWHEMLLPDSQERRVVLEVDPIEKQIEEVDRLTYVQTAPVGLKELPTDEYDPSVIQQHAPEIEGDDGES